jgi:hypothetical protein
MNPRRVDLPWPGPLLPVLPQLLGGDGTEVDLREINAPTVEPKSRYRVSVPETSSLIIVCASSVEPPMCGMRMISFSARGSCVHGFSWTSKGVPFAPGLGENVKIWRWCGVTGVSKVVTREGLAMREKK